jgi:hypothetical protein
VTPEEKQQLREEWTRQMGFINPGAWCQYAFSFNAFGDSESILLAVLSGQFAAEIAAEKDEGTWMRMPTNRILAKLPCWTRQKVKRVLRGLRDVIDIEVRGTWKKPRWVKLDPLRLQRRLAVLSPGVTNDPSLFQGSKMTPPPGVKNDPQDRRGGRIDLVPAGRGPITVKVLGMRPKVPAHCPDCSSTDWRLHGESLRTAIGKVTTVPKTAKPGQWGAQIRALHVRDGVPLAHVEEVLAWYGRALPLEGDINTNGNPNFMPVAYSGESFRKKFLILRTRS